MDYNSQAANAQLGEPTYIDGIREGVRRCVELLQNHGDTLSIAHGDLAVAVWRACEMLERTLGAEAKVEAPVCELWYGETARGYGVLQCMNCRPANPAKVTK